MPVKATLKIVLLTREYPPDSAWGGIASLYHSLASALSNQGHEVHVICQSAGKPEDQLQDGVHVHRVGTNPRRYSALARVNYSWAAYTKLKLILEAGNVDVVEANLWGAEGFLYGLRKSVPLVVRDDTSSRDEIIAHNYSGLSNRMELKFLSLLEDYSLRKADRIITVSQLLNQRILKMPGLQPHKVVLIHHSIDTSLFKYRSSNIKTEIGLSNDSKIVLCVGRLEPIKGYDIVCRAIPEILKSVPDLKFVFVGRDTQSANMGGSFKANIQNAARQNNFTDNLFFIEYMSPSGLALLYSACDVYLAYSRQESFGLTVIEAMSCGAPVIATPVGIVPELEQYSLGGIQILPSGDIAALSKAVIRAVNLKPEERSSIKQENRSLVESEFSFSTWVPQVLKVYREVIERDNPSHSLKRFAE